ncbi:protocadherin gamma-C5-like isoform X13 [Spea bombifrons]|uniref:protocadherin gamma-C5-like isoform X13 n=1 Tax=Spea bombifrons TaxID=233779 RepID=UPI0023497CB0|nr:protocadherin gamma-C5-like isoform X13 [Spea bombifrons]
MDFRGSLLAWKWQVVCVFFLCSWDYVAGQLRYSVIEELEPGTLVGNIAQDLGFKPGDILEHRLYLGSIESKKYFALDTTNGALIVNGRIDRETLCGSSPECVLHIELVSEIPLQLYNLEIEILDINDNFPTFFTSNRIIKITEVFTSPGARFALEIAQDLDVGINGISQYILNQNPYFSLSVKSHKDGTLIPQLVLEKTLDREEKQEHKLTLTAFDGGEPTKSGSCLITIFVLDINDNAPMFDQSIYKVRLKENAPLETVIVKLNATDLDEGTNGEIEYFFDDHTFNSAKKIFNLNSKTGEIDIKGSVDFEDTNYFELSVRAVDTGLPELEGSCLIQVEVEDENDNIPEITVTSMINDVPENALLGTVIGFISVKDNDSGKNGEVYLELSPNIPFKIKPFKNHFSLVTDGYLDREKIPQYTIELLAFDYGTPVLHSQATVHLSISDVNDNPPVFSQPSYTFFAKENNDPGTFINSVSAFDLDEGLNSNLIYSIEESQIDGSSVSSFVYINPNDGSIYAQRSFDYEHVQVIQMVVTVGDSGSPKLFSNTSVCIFVLDTNDNYPIVINPEVSKDLVVQERISKFASAGFLATKISAIDKDSGHNAWLAFSLLQPINSSLFQISPFTGEIRTTRGYQETDTIENQLVISIRDHGDPPLSTTVTVLFHIVDNIAIENTKYHDSIENFKQDGTENLKSPSDLTLYLIISLVAIGLVSIITFIILLIKCVRKEDYNGCCFLNSPQPKHYLEPYKPTLYLNTDGTLKYMEVRMVPTEPQGQPYQAFLPPATENTNFNLMKPLDDSVNDPSDTTLLQDAIQAQPNTEWRFSQAQRPGPSGAQPTEEAGVWPNNQFETERLQAMILASANEAAEGTSGLGGGTGTMGLSARYGPQFTLQHVPDYRQNVYIPGSTLTPTNAAGKRDGKSGGNKKKSGKKEKK